MGEPPVFWYATGRTCAQIGRTGQWASIFGAPQVQDLLELLEDLVESENIHGAIAVAGDDVPTVRSESDAAAAFGEEPAVKLFLLGHVPEKEFARNSVTIV